MEIAKKDNIIRHVNLALNLVAIVFLAFDFGRTVVILMILSWILNKFNPKAVFLRSEMRDDRARIVEILSWGLWCIGAILTFYQTFYASEYEPYMAMPFVLLSFNMMILFPDFINKPEQAKK